MSNAAPTPENETLRLSKLQYYNILDSEAEQMFDDLTKLAAKLLDVPISLISLVDENRQWFKSKQGIDVSETPRDISFCQHAIMNEELLQISDALEDERFKNSPLVLSGPKIRFYMGAPLIDDDGAAIGTFCVIDTVPRVINEKQKESLRLISNTAMHLIKLRKEKLDAEKLSLIKDEFLANMSHEIRTPLNAIMGFNDLLKKTILTQEQEDYLNTIQISSQNLKVIINDILDVAKLESGRIQLEKKAISLSALLQHVIRLQAPLAKERGIKLVTSFDFDIPAYVVADETRLTQILINLVSNAIKFTSEGTVELRAIVNSSTKNNVSVEFSVKDTGIGISKDKLQTIFERFSQAETSTTRLFGGTGLGLSIVNMLINLHESNITVESECDKGSEFKFAISFEVTEKKEAQELFTIDKKENTKAFNNIAVLLIEDNFHNQLLAKNYFKRWGAEITIAENGQIGVDLLREKKFDVILMDLQMPVMDGFNATKCIREELRLTIPIIGCSAHSLAGEKEKCMKIGMDDYIAKPYTEEELIQTTLHYATAVNSPENNSITNGKFKIEEPKKELSNLIFDDFDSLINKLKKEEGDEFVDEMSSFFVERTPNDISEIKIALANKDFEALMKKSHMLSGTLGIFGFAKGRQLSSAIEQKAKQGNKTDVIELSQQLVDYLYKAVENLS